MKIGMMVPNYARWFRGDGIWATCEKGKELGLDALCFVDHVMVTPHQYVGYGNGYMDEWTAMAYVAAVTNAQGWRPILTQGVWVVPYRPAIQTAKVIATVDSLSGGRVLIGAGSGYNENEFRSLSLNVKERGDMTDEYLECMQELWTHPVASFHGKYNNFDEMTISVRPAQQPYPPIIYGSHGPRPFRRIAERYQGWFGSGGRTTESLQRFEKDSATVDSLWKEYGRQGKPYQMALAMTHLTTDRSQAGSVITKGLDSPELGSPEVVTLSDGRTYERFDEGTQRTYASSYHMTHVDDYVQQLRTMADQGVDMAVVWLPSYRFGSLDNQEMQLQQMELLAEHVLPKIPKDNGKIEFDFGGKLESPIT